MSFFSFKTSGKASIIKLSCLCLNHAQCFCNFNPLKLYVEKIDRIQLSLTALMVIMVLVFSSIRLRKNKYLNKYLNYQSISTSLSRNISNMETESVDLLRISDRIMLGISMVGFSFITIFGGLNIN